MPVEPSITNESLTKAVHDEGSLYVPAESTRRLLEQVGTLDDWTSFSASWNDLHTDTYMADQGRYRLRRHAVFTAGSDGAIVRGEARPHYQSLDYNRLNGGVPRWFTPIDEALGAGRSLSTILSYCFELFSALKPAFTSWDIEVHQFRILAKVGVAGQPTPEGMHRDGVDFALVLMIHRENITSGTTLIGAPDGRQLGSFTLIDPLDAVFLDDHRVYHGVTAVEPLDPNRPAHRDVLVVTFRDEDPALRAQPA